MVTFTFRHFGSGMANIVNDLTQKRYKKVKWWPVPHNGGPSTLKSQSASLIQASLYNSPCSGNSNCCSSAFGHVNCLEQKGNWETLSIYPQEINSDSDARVSGWDIRQLPCLFLNLAAGEQSKESLPPFHPPRHSPFHKSCNPFELMELLLIASYWPVTKWSMGKRQSFPIHIFSGQQGSLQK